MLFGQENAGVRRFGDKSAAFRIFSDYPLTDPSYATDGMNLTREWLVGTTAYSDLANTTAASVRVDATISDSDTGVLMESGGSGLGLILCVYAGVLYFQCGDGGDFGTSSDRAETSYTLPAGTSDYVIEWSANTSNSVLYVNGLKVDEQAYISSLISGSNPGATGRIELASAKNRGGFSTQNGTDVYTNTITRCLVFKNQVTIDV
jgi:hypothetical protein